jgi:hypothetical protein
MFTPLDFTQEKELQALSIPMFLIEKVDELNGMF